MWFINCILVALLVTVNADFHRVPIYKQPSVRNEMLRLSSPVEDLIPKRYFEFRSIPEPLSKFFSTISFFKLSFILKTNLFI